MISRELPPQGSARTYPGLDAVRFIAALMVAGYHLGFWLWQPVRGDFAFHDVLAPLGPFVSYGWVGVPVFFVISGFVIAFSASRKDAKAFVIGRALRLYPAAWICGSITFVLAGSWADYLRTVTLSPIGPWVSGVYWTLAIEIVFYLLVAFTVWRGGSIRRLAIGLGFYSSAFWLLKATNAVSGGAIDFTVIENYTGYLLLAHDGIFFALGMLLWRKRHLLAAILFACVGFAAILWRSHAMAVPGAPFFVAPLVWAACSAAVAWFAFFNPPLRRWPTRKLGLMTYPLYLVHVELGGAIMLACAPLGAWAALAIGLGSVLFVAFAVLPAETAVRTLLGHGHTSTRAEPASLP
jgi:peptidoglycan/LPS O-acetylase OafA/YrhL